MGAKPSVRDIPKGGMSSICLRSWGASWLADQITTDFGSSIRLKGDFRAMSTKDGEQFAAMQAYLPSDAAALVASQLGRGVVEFAFKIGVKDSPDSSTGYEYVSQPLKVTDDDCARPDGATHGKGYGRENAAKN
jgi:hypothetical protein